MQWLRSIFRVRRRLVGTDLDGNKYYEVLQGAGRKARREVITNLKHEDYKAGVIPTEWDAWLRGSVADPPSHEDLIKKQHQQMLLSKRVLEVIRRDKKLQEKEYADGLVAKPLGHASKTTYGNIASSEEPRTSGNQFHPGVWGKQSSIKQNQAFTEQDSTEKFEPEAWKPS